MPVRFISLIEPPTHESLVPSFFHTFLARNREKISGPERKESMWPFVRKGESGFSWYSTAEEVTDGIDASGLTAIVTEMSSILFLGASSGIGTETTRVLALRGAHVVMGVRNVSAGATVKNEILKEIPNAQIDVLELDLASMASVRKFASDFKAMNLPLNILINNAGVMATPFSLSKDGIELQFATNHVGHFLLTDLLLENLKNTSRESNIEGRIVIVSSMGHKFAYREGGILFDKINDQSVYNTIAAYGQSKLANILHANELSRRFKEEGVEITANSLHPGSIITNLLRYHSVLDVIHRTLGKLVLKNAKQGAATTCYVALHPKVRVTGRYFCDSNLDEPSSRATDADLGKKLWDFSMNLVN